MQFKCPENVASVSVEGKEYMPDATGIITVSDDLPPHVLAEFTTAGLVVASGETVEKNMAEDAERAALFEKLAGFGVPVDKRRRYSMETLREMAGAAELTSILKAKAEAGELPGATPGAAA